MMYIVTRSSDSKKKPIDDCTREKVHFYEYILVSCKDNPDSWKHFERRNRNIHKTIDGKYYTGTNKEDSEVYVAVVNDLHEFVNQYGDIILSEPDNEEGLWRIEIYDDYRE